MGCPVLIAPNNTIGAYVERFLLARDVCELYADNVRARVLAFEEWAECQVELTSLSPDLLNGWIMSLQKLGLSPWTVKGARANLLAVWNAAADERLCDYPIPRQIRKIVPPQQITEGWSQAEVEILVVHCLNLTGRLPNGISRAAYYSSVVRVGYDSGARRGDVLCLTQKQIDTGGLWTWVQSKKGVAHSVRLHASTLRSIESSYPPDRPLVFEWPYSRNHWTIEFGRIVRDAGLRGSYKWLRRSAGSLVEAQLPGAGHKLLCNGSAVFDRHYSVARIANANLPQPPELNS